MKDIAKYKDLFSLQSLGFESVIDYTILENSRIWKYILAIINRVTKKKDNKKNIYNDELQRWFKEKKTLQKIT